jgi:hypothetical protein
LFRKVSAETPRTELKHSPGLISLENENSVVKDGCPHYMTFGNVTVRALAGCGYRKLRRRLLCAADAPAQLIQWSLQARDPGGAPGVDFVRHTTTSCRRRPLAGDQSARPARRSRGAAFVMVVEPVDVRALDDRARNVPLLGRRRPASVQ